MLTAIYYFGVVILTLHLYMYIIVLSIMYNLAHATFLNVTKRKLGCVKYWALTAKVTAGLS